MRDNAGTGLKQREKSVGRDTVLRLKSGQADWASAALCAPLPCLTNVALPRAAAVCLTLLEPQSRFGDNPLNF